MADCDMSRLYILIYLKGFKKYSLNIKDVMRSINGLKESTKYARDQYVSWKQSYIKESFGRPLEKLHVRSF